MWQHVLRSLVSILAVVVLGMPSPAVIAQEAPVLYVDLPAEHQAMAQWAVGLFAEAGLDLPPLRYVYHGDERSACRGRRGLHHTIQGVSVVEICTAEATFPAQAMILHETAHAWADLSLSDERKEAFQALRGWQYWRNYAATEWYQNGTEQAAEIMVWGLIDRPIRLATIDYDDCDDLAAGYRVLTGAQPLHGLRDRC